MQIPPFVQTTYRKLGRKLVDVGILEDREEKVKRIAELNQIIDQANLVEEFLSSRIWMEILKPWIDTESDQEIDSWVNHQIKYKEDIGAYHHSGAIQKLAEMVSMLQQRAVKKENAQKELLSLTDKENQ